MKLSDWVILWLLSIVLAIGCLIQGSLTIGIAMLICAIIIGVRVNLE